MSSNNKPSTLLSSDRITVAENTPEVYGTMVITDIDGMSNPNYRIHTNAKSGSAIIESDGQWIYYPQADWIGWDYFLVVVTDDQGFISTHHMHIFVKPFATDDFAKTESGTAVDIDVLANDTMSGDNKVITHINGQAVSVGSIVNVANGQAQLLANGEVKFIPNPGYVGTTTFDYTVKTDTRPAVVSNVTVRVTDGVELPEVTVDPIDFINSPYPLVSGTTTSGSQVTVEIRNESGVLVVSGNAVVNLNGAWTFVDPNTPLLEGNYTILVTAQNSDGSVQATENFVIDLTAPIGLTAELDNDTGLNDNDQITIDGKVNVSGLETGAVWSYSLDGGLNWIQGSGASFVVPQGNYLNVLVKQVDQAGNGQTISLGAITVDTTLPLVTVNPVGIISSTSTIITGTTTGGRITLEIRDEQNNVIGTGTATVTGGTWSYTVQGLVEGQYTVTAIAESLAGATSNASQSFFIDLTPPTGMQVQLVEDTGIVGDGITNNGQVKVSGVESSATWSYSLNGTTWIAGSDTSFTLPAGNYTTVWVKQTDPAGLEQIVTLGPIVVDLTGPALPVVTLNDEFNLRGLAEAGSTITVNVGGTIYTTTTLVTGQWSFVPNIVLSGQSATITATDVAGNSSGSLTIMGPGDTTPPDDPIVTVNTEAVLSGIAEEGSIITLIVNGQTQTTITSSTGVWSFAPNPIGVGGSGIITATDAAGNSSFPINVLGPVDTTAPDAPVISVNTEAALTGTAEAGSTITVTVGDTTYTTITTVTGQWGFAPNPVAPGASATVTATDAAGNASAGVTITGPGDTTAPDAPVITQNIDAGLSGTAEAGSTITVTVGDTTYTTITTVTGQWGFAPNPVAPGASATVTATDAAGNASAGVTITGPGDTTAPDAPVITQNIDAGLSGTAEAGSTITVTVGDTTYTTITTVTGQWGFAPNPVAPGASATVTATDAAGNASAGVTITGPGDTTAPDAPVIDALGEIASLTPTISGTAEAGSIITVTITAQGGAATTVTAVTDASGNWSVLAPLAEGNYTVTATATDAAGNTSLVSQGQQLAIDVTAPTVTLTVTDNTTLVLTSTEGGDYSVDVAGTIYTGTVTAGGSVSITVNPSLTGGEQISAVVTDSAGNAGTATTTVLVANPDEVNLDLQGLVVTNAQAAETQASLAIIDLLSGSAIPTFAQAQANGKLVNIGPNSLGTLAIEMNQVSLLSIAQAVQVFVFDQEGNIVHRAMTSDNPLVGDVLGVSFLGLTDGGGLSTTVSALDSGNYYVLVANDESLISQITAEFTLADLGQDGVVIGADNQQLILDAVSAGLGGGPLATTVTGLLTPVLTLLNGVGIDQLVEPLISILNSVGAVNLVDDVLDELTRVLLNNTLNVLEFTSLTTQVTEFGFSNDDVIGNVLTDDVPVAGSVITAVTGAGNSTVNSTTGAITVEGAYGTLVMNTDGTYQYTANLEADIVGEADVFTYTVTNNGVSASTTLTININDFSVNPMTLSLQQDTGSSTTDGITNNAVMLVTGVELGAVWEYSVNGGVTWSVGAGDRFTVPEGSYAVGAVQVRQTNWAGVTGSPILSTTAIVIDTQIEVDIYGGVDDTGVIKGHFNNGDSIDDQRPQFYGSAEPGSTISLVVRGPSNELILSDSGPVGPSGEWTYSVVNGDLPVGKNTLEVTVTDVAGNSTSKTMEFYVNAADTAPQVAVNSGSLLGLIGADLAGLIDFDQQKYAVADVNDNLTSVTLTAATTVGVGLPAPSWSWSTQLAAEFGYTVTPVYNWTPLLVAYSGSMTLTITPPAGQVLDNQKVNELLGTVKNADTIIDLQILGSLTISATDSTGLSATADVGDLLGVELLGGLLGNSQSYLKQGTAAGDELNNSAATDSVRIYGYGGDDTLIGGKGNDIIRGGAGDDTINGGAGNDYIVGGAGNDIITGGVGADTVVFELLNSADARGGNGTDTWTDFSLVQGDVIDISALLPDNVAAVQIPVTPDGGAATWYDSVHDYVKLEYNAQTETVTVKVDRDGVGTAHSATDVLYLTNQKSEITLQQLIDNQQILF